MPRPRASRDHTVPTATRSASATSASRSPARSRSTTTDRNGSEARRSIARGPRAAGASGTAAPDCPTTAGMVGAAFRTGKDRWQPRRANVCARMRAGPLSVPCEVDVCEAAEDPAAKPCRVLERGQRAPRFRDSLRDQILRIRDSTGEAQSRGIQIGQKRVHLLPDCSPSITPAMQVPTSP